MPRIFRILPEEGVLHILARGNNRQQIFKENTDYKTYLRFLKIYKQENCNIPLLFNAQSYPSNSCY